MRRISLGKWVGQKRRLMGNWPGLPGAPLLPTSDANF
jgi:hypothetical protein